MQTRDAGRADMPRARGRRDALRVLVALGTTEDLRRARDCVDALAARYDCSLTLVGVAARSLFIESFAPLSGAATPRQLAEARDLAARDIAGGAAALLREGSVDAVITASGWGCARLLDRLRAGVYDALVVGSLPRGRTARARLLAAARTSDTAVFHA